MSEKGKPEDDFDQFDTGECTDPNTGTYFAFEGTVVLPCPSCGMENTARTERPTNKIPYHCLNCGSDFVIQNTLTPVNDEEARFLGSDHDDEDSGDDEDDGDDEAL